MINETIIWFSLSFQWRQELDDILKVALADSDHWVAMVAELLKTFPETGAINYDIEENAEVFTELVHELKKSGKNQILSHLFTSYGISIHISSH